METSKKWVKGGDSVFTLWDNKQQIGTMEIARGTSDRKANALIQDKEFQIKKTGFWKSHLEIVGKNGQIIAKVYSEKWYANSYILEFEDKKYKLLVRNNPLAEWAIQENGNDILSYGLTTDKGKPSIKISSKASVPKYLFDFILWYLFLPIATEQGADDATFLLLVS